MPMNNTEFSNQDHRAIPPLKTCSGPQQVGLELEPLGLDTVLVDAKLQRLMEKQKSLFDSETCMDDRFLWHIHGKRYDFRKFVNKHPAGPTMILMGQGRDCTELFESYHAMTDLPGKLLSRYEVRRGEPPIEESMFHWETTPFFDVLKQRVRAHFKDSRRSHKANTEMISRMILGMLSLVIILYFWVQGHWWTLLPLPFVYWTTCSLMMHSGAHGAISHNWRVNHYLSYFGSFHSSLTTWIHQHNIGHHTQTNIDGRDPDLQHFQHLAPDKAPGYRLTNMQPWLPKYTNYMFAMFFQANFSASGPALLCEPLYYSTDSYLGAVPYMYLTDLDMLKHWAGRAFVFFTMFVLPFVLHGPVKGLFFAFIPYNLLGIIFYIFSQVSHLSETCFDKVPPAPDSKEGKPEWAVHQVISACDYNNRSWLWGALSIGLNNQIVHHLFPAVDPCHYPDIVPIFENACAEFGIKYAVYNSWAEVWGKHVDWVAHLNGAEPPYDSRAFKEEEVTGANWAELARARTAADRLLRG